MTRGRGDERALDRAVATGRAVRRVWRPARRVAFGPRDRRASGYDRAREAARSRGYAPTERAVGGRAVAYTGRTVAFALARPTAARTATTARYDAVLPRVVEALTGLGADVAAGEPPDAFCPGGHGVRVAGGGKVAGLAQRVRADAAVVAGCVLVDDRDAQRAVLGPVYRALGHPLDPAAVGDLAAAGCDASPDAVVRALRAALAPAQE